MHAKLLIVDDEVAIRDMIRFSLEEEPFDLKLAGDCKAAEFQLAELIPDVILLDWMLPDKSGIDFIKWLKQHEDYQHIPVIMLTAKAEEENKVRGLMTGADDYITKPFSPDELIARIHVVLRRGPLLSPDNEIKIKDLVINLATCKVSINHEELVLTANEFNMLRFFIKNPNKTFSRTQLITQLHGSNSFIDERTIDSQIRRLRDKLKTFNYQDLIKTVRGIGYTFILNKEVCYG